MNFESSLEDYINYLSTLSFYKKFRHIYPDKEDPLLSIYRGFVINIINYYNIINN